MKSSQFMNRIESAGWRRIRADGSHFVYEHPRYGRVLYAKGRPQSEISKRLARQYEEKFHLEEIEAAKIDARLEEAKHRPESARVTLARVVAEPPAAPSEPEPELSDRDIKVLWSQLHRDHKVTLVDLGRKLEINSVALTDYVYHGKPLYSAERARLIAYFLEQERTLHLTRNREELIARGYGYRTGGSNRSDPFLDEVRPALLKTLDAGVLMSDLAKTIGVSPATLHGIKFGRTKTVYPTAKAKLQKWYQENWSEPEATASNGAEAAQVGATQAPTVAVTVQDEDADEELAAIQRVMRAVKGLPPNAARRALRYVLERL